MVGLRYDRDQPVSNGQKTPNSPLAGSPRMTAPDIPGYEDLELIGKGGFSRVYRAEQSKLKRNVAIKVLNFGLNDETDRVGFERETELMGRVSAHPDIVTVHDTEFTSQGQPCIVMELYPGGSLAEMIVEIGRLSAKEALEVGVAIASALDASHRSGVLHCDLKPQNILISEFGQVALGDFGISTFAEERTRTGSENGAGFTLPYAAPEIVEGESPSAATDIYSLAATLYTGLAGHRPFQPPTEQKPPPAEQARRILLEDVPSLVSYGVPPELDELLRRAMSKEPGDRPRSAADFGLALHRIGQQLGLGTSAPRTAEGGALRTVDTADAAPQVADVAEVTGPFRRLDPDPATAPEPIPQPEPKQRASDAFVAAPASQDLLADNTVHRVDAQLEPEPEPVVEDDDSVSTRRRVLAIALSVVGLIAVAAVVFFITRGGETVAEPEPDEPPVNAPITDPAVAPATPRNVELERLGATGLRITWAPGDEDDTEDVVYEVRRRDVEDFAAVRTSDTELVLNGIAGNEAPCVTIMAVRSNRTSPEAAPECLAAQVGNGFIELRPETCAQGGCEVRIVLADFPADSQVAVLVQDPEGLDLNGFGDVYETTVQTDSRGQIDSWRLSLPPLFGPGDYVVVVGDDVGETFSALLTVTE